MIISFSVPVFVLFGLPVVTCAACIVADTYFQYMYFKWNKEERKRKFDQVKD